jgi:hypothetical protein
MGIKLLKVSIINHTALHCVGRIILLLLLSEPAWRNAKTSTNQMRRATSRSKTFIENIHARY